MDVGDELAGRYRLVRFIARGGGGEVWEAEDRVLIQPVALKHVEFTSNDADQRRLERERMMREARAAARLRAHPHVVAIYDVLDVDGDVWLVLEYLPSRSLDARPGTDGGWDRGEVARIGAAVADALAAAHRAGIVHRDVKPGNVLLGSEDGRVMLADFGVSQVLDAPSITSAHVVAGTPSYMAPEIARGEPATPAADVYALGATLYELLEGTPPHGSEANALRQLQRIAHEPLRPPRHDSDLMAVVMRLLAYDPAVRPDAETAAETLHRQATLPTRDTERLEPLAPPDRGPDAGMAPHAAVTVVHDAPRGAPSPRRWVLAAVAGAVVVALAAAAVALLAGVGPDRPVTLAGDPRDADACALLDPAALAEIGAVGLGPGRYVGSCRASVATPDGVVRVDSWFGARSTQLIRSTSPPEPIGPLLLHREGLIAGECSQVIELAGGILANLRAWAPPGGALDPCSVGERAGTAAVDALDERGVVSAPGWQQGVALAREDACAVLDATTATALALDPLRRAGFGGWSCFLGRIEPDAPYVTVRFGIEPAGTVAGYGVPTDVPGFSAVVRGTAGTYHPLACQIYLPRPTGLPPGPDGAVPVEFVSVTVESTRDLATLCGQAQAIARPAAARLR